MYCFVGDEQYLFLKEILGVIFISEINQKSRSEFGSKCRTHTYSRTRSQIQKSLLVNR